MNLTRQALGGLLAKQLELTVDPRRISDWAHDTYVSHHNLEAGVSDALMELMVMSEGPEFEMSPDELGTLAKRLMDVA